MSLDLDDPPPSFVDHPQHTLTLQLPAGKHEELEVEIRETARNECHLLVPVGYNHTCYIEEGPEAPSFVSVYSGEPSNDVLESEFFIAQPFHATIAPSTASPQGSPRFYISSPIQRAKPNNYVARSWQREPGRPR